MVLRKPVFLIQSGWKKSGAVVPLCDFHWSITLIGCESMLFLYVRPRARVARVSAHKTAAKVLEIGKRFCNTQTALSIAQNPKKV